MHNEISVRGYYAGLDGAGLPQKLSLDDLNKFLIPACEFIARRRGNLIWCCDRFQIKRGD